MSSNQKLHEVGVKALQITGKSQHPDAFKAAIMIYKKGRNQEEREEGENILRIMVDDALDNHHSFHASIALLGYTTSVDANDKKVGTLFSHKHFKILTYLIILLESSC